MNKIVCNLGVISKTEKIKASSKPFFLYCKIYELVLFNKVCTLLMTLITISKNSNFFKRSFISKHSSLMKTRLLQSVNFVNWMSDSLIMAVLGVLICKLMKWISCCHYLCILSWLSSDINNFPVLIGRSLWIMHNVKGNTL